MLLAALGGLAIAALVYSQMQLGGRLASLQTEVATLRAELRFLRGLVQLTEDEDPAPAASGVLAEEPRLFDWSGGAQVLLCVLLQVLELSRAAARLQSVHDRPYLSYFKYNVPAASAVLFALSHLLSWLAYSGLVRHALVIAWFSKTLVLWSAAVYVSNVAVNCVRIARYLPSSREAWLGKLRDRAWWWWLATRTLGADSLESCIQLGAFALTRLLYALPFRYFFLAQRSPAVDAFLVNQVAHTSLVCLLFYLYELSASGAYPLLSRAAIQRIPDFDILNLAGVVLFGYSLLLSLLRVCWLFFHGGGSLWGSLLFGPLLLVGQALFVFGAIPIMMALPLKKEYHRRFVTRLRSEEAADAASEDSFCAVLDFTTRLYVFNRIRIDGEDETKLEGADLFDRLFQTAMLTMKASAAEEEEDESRERGAGETASPESCKDE